MQKEQLEKLLLLYKKAIDEKLTSEDFAKEVKAANIEIDQSFVQTGSKDKNLGEYLNELYKLQQFAK